jgi:hypothetical protein
VNGNVDRALSKGKGRSAVAAIFHSVDEQYLGASALVINGVLDPSTIETIACKEALCLARDAGFRSMITASDYAGVVQGIHEGSLGETNAMILKEIRNMKVAWDKVVFKFEGKEDNGDSHSIARLSLDLAPGRHVWFLEPPGFVNFSITD